jgi:hypothetical protein
MLRAKRKRARSVSATAARHQVQRTASKDDDGKPEFQVLPSPDTEEILRLAESLAERIPKLLRARGLGPDSHPEESDPLARDESCLAGIYAAAVLGRAAFGPNAGRRAPRIGDQVDPENIDALGSPRCATVSGFSLHANTAVHAGDRQRLERLVRYCARPPVAVERLEPLADGRLLYRFKRPFRDGTTHVVFEPLDMLERLAALVPAPRAHLVRYSGVLAPAAKWRPLIVPATSIEGSEETDAPGLSADAPGGDTEFSGFAAIEPERAKHRRNYSWAELMKRASDFSSIEAF